MRLIIGEASRSGTPLEGYSGHRLAKLAGMPLQELLDRVVALNLLRRWPGRVRASWGNGDRFPMDSARRAARNLEIPAGASVILLGKRVAGAFLYPDAEWFDHVLVQGVYCMVFPHPSGVSRWWNSRRNRREAARRLRAWLEGASWPL